MKPRRSRHWRTPYFWAGIALSIACLALVFRQVDLAETWRIIALADYRLILLATLNIVVVLLAKTARWRLLFYPAQANQDYSSLLSALTAGVFINFALPLRFGDLVRMYLAGLGDTGLLHALGTVAVEKLLDAIALAVMLLVLLPTIGLPAWLLQPAWTMAALALLGLVSAMAFRSRFLRLLQVIETRVPLIARLKASDRARRVLDSLDPLSRGSVLLRLGAWTLLIWCLSFLTHYFLLRSMGLNVSLVTPLLLHTVLQAGIAVPSSPAKLGVFHGLCIWALSLSQIVGATAAGYSILLYFVVWMPPSILGTIFLWRSGRTLELLRRAAGDSGSDRT